MPRKSYNRSVFINCPFDDRYNRLFRAAVFAVLRCDFYARCAQEEEDSSEVRLHKIYRMIEECRFGIHDLSRTEVDRRTGFPRFNMPLELGIFLAAKHFRRGEQDKKVCLIFERRLHSYEAYVSDIKGMDIATHRNNPETMIRRIRDWLANNSRRQALPGGHAVCQDYGRYCRWLPRQCRQKQLRSADLTFNDYANLVYEWIETQH